MWLLKTGPWPPGVPGGIELHQRENDREPYAILSHCWGKLKDEILFEDLLSYCDQSIRQDAGYISVDYRQGPGATLRNKQGWFKIEASMKQARADGYGWLWADTCCINKNSSAELSEAINSMYAWYEGAAICYVFMNDVSSHDPDELRRDAFYGSRWFTRGWTLQELIAPKTVIFYSQEWSPLGNKQSLASALTAITKIDEETLIGIRPIESASIAQRMSWAANRQTSRLEDRAYSLMGLFAVNMPMLYGEGNRAFQRLQQEIMKLSDDQSIFSWIDANAAVDTKHGLLADDPSAFVYASQYRAYSVFEDMKPFDMSNRGLSINLPLTPTNERDVFVAALHCPVPSTSDGFLAIYLQKLPTGERQYARVRCDSLASLSARGPKQDIYVRPSFQRQDEWAAVMPAHYLAVRKVASTNDLFRYSIVSTVGVPADDILDSFYEVSNWRPSKSLPTTVFKFVKKKGQLSAALKIRRQDGEMLTVLLGARTDFEPGFDVHGCDPESVPATLTQLDDGFNAEEFRSTLGIENHMVTVQAEQRTKDAVKVYFIDIFIKGQEKKKDEDLPERLLDDTKKRVSRMSKVKGMFGSQ